jgi:cyanophycin synthetase
VILFALDGDHPVLKTHREQGHRVVFVRDGRIIFAEGQREQPLVPVSDVPVARDGRVPFQVENAIAAAGAAWGFGVAVELIRAGLETFGVDPLDLPGRFHVQEHQGATVVIDDCHNTSALSALVDALDRFSNERRTAVYSAGNGRRNVDIVRQGEQLGGAFDRVIVYDDVSATDRSPGEVTALLRQGLAKGTRVRQVDEIASYREAVAAALEQVVPGDLILIQTEDEEVEPALDCVRQFTLRQVPADCGCVTDPDARDSVAPSAQR